MCIRLYVGSSENLALFAYFRILLCKVMDEGRQTERLSDWQADKLTERQRWQCCKGRRHVTQSLAHSLSHTLTPHSGIDSHYFFILIELYLNYKLKNKQKHSCATQNCQFAFRPKTENEGGSWNTGSCLSICLSWLSKKKWNGSATTKSIYLSQFSVSNEITVKHSKVVRWVNNSGNWTMHPVLT